MKPDSIEVDSQTSNMLVILIHGIRTNASYYADVRKVLEENGFKVEFTNYDRFDLIRFLLPFDVLRKKAAAKVEKQIDNAIFMNKGVEEVSIIAHSFGTYLFGKILAEKANLKVNKVILCGSVLRSDFNFANMRHKFDSPILNEVGTRDHWPAIAEAVTIGYGAAGTWGFKNSPVVDRWHNRLNHVDFNNGEFCKKYWVPFLREGKIEDGDNLHEKPPWYLSLIQIVWVRVALRSLLLFVVTYFFVKVALLSYENISDTGVSVVKTVTLETYDECIKDNDQGCSANDSNDYQTPNGDLFISEESKVTFSDGAGLKNISCKLDFSEKVQIETAKGPRVFAKKVTLSGHAESGSGLFGGYSGTTFTKCVATIKIIQFNDGFWSNFVDKIKEIYS